MAKEATVAPKERVNIVYRPATGDAQEEVELPLKLLVIGDFTGKTDERMLEDREPINIEKDRNLIYHSLSRTSCQRILRTKWVLT